MTPQPDGWEAVALTLATATVAGLALAEQFRYLPGAVVAHGAAWVVGRAHRRGSLETAGGVGG